MFVYFVHIALYIADNCYRNRGGHVSTLADTPTSGMGCPLPAKKITLT